MYGMLTSMQASRLSAKDWQKLLNHSNVLGNCTFGLLTAFDPYSKGDRDRGDCRKKMKEISDLVHFMEDYSIAPHNRYVVIQTNKETRWWSLPDGLVSGMSRG